MAGISGKVIDEGYVEIGFSDDKLSKGLAAAEQKRRAFESGFKSTGRSLDASFKMIAMGAGLATGGVALLYKASQNFIREAVKEAAAVRIFSVAMGEASGKARAFAGSLQKLTGADLEDIFQQMGQAALAIQNMGMGEQAAEAMAETATKIGYAIANMRGMEDAGPIIDSVTRAMMGMTRGLQPYGIKISEAAVKQKGMEMGLADMHGNLSETGTALAAYAKIVEQAAIYQTDFNSENEKTIKNIRAEASAWDDLKAALGRAMSGKAGAGKAIAETLNPESENFMGAGRLASFMEGGPDPEKFQRQQMMERLSPVSRERLAGIEAKWAKQEDADKKERQETEKAATKALMDEELFREKNAQAMKDMLEKEKKYQETLDKETEQREKYVREAKKQLPDAQRGVRDAQRSIRDRNLETIGGGLSSGKGLRAFDEAQRERWRGEIEEAKTKWIPGSNNRIGMLRNRLKNQSPSTGVGPKERFDAFMEARKSFQDVSALERTTGGLGPEMAKLKGKSYERMSALGGEFFGAGWQELAKPEQTAEERQLTDANETLREILEVLRTEGRSKLEPATTWG